MSAPVLVLILLDFACIGMLPVVFFRRNGRLGPLWWLTALPFFCCPVLLLGVALAGAEPPTPGGWSTVLAAAAVVPGAASIALIFLTLGTHRTPVALWHQENDAPRHLVTNGAYSRIRHPFYTAFLLAFVAAFVSFPHVATLGLLGYALAVLNFTAAREEGRLSASEFGAQYLRYRAETGRFLPRLGR